MDTSSLKTLVSSRKTILVLVAAALAASLFAFVALARAQTDPVDAKINFQPEKATGGKPSETGTVVPVPPGYTADSGQAYDGARGYGWVTQESAGTDASQPLSIVQNSRDRGLNNDQRLDTLLHMQAPSTSSMETTPAAWEYDLPNGTYLVTVAVGDPSFGQDAESHTINVEGTNAISGFPKQPNSGDTKNGSDARHKTTTVEAEVTDGKLTVDAKGGENTKINYVEIVDAPAADSFELDVNFQNEAGALPAGYLKDFGQGYGVRGDSGLTYGWIEQDNPDQPINLTDNGRDRNANNDQRLDTLMHMQLSADSPGTWEMNVPDGEYQIKVSAGDASNSDSVHTVNVEGVNAIEGFVPPSSNTFADATVTVPVTDGKLTVDAKGGENTKINYINLVRTGDAAAPEPTTPEETTSEPTTPADTEAPETSIDSGPTGTVDSDSATFSFSSSEENSTFECKLDDGTYENCASPKSYSGLADGQHTFSVRATDAAGNVDESPASQTWTVETADTTAPAAPTGLNATSGDGQVELSWDANSENDLAGYNVYRGASEDIDTSGQPLNDQPLTDPAYTDNAVENGTVYHYAVVAVDGAGNASGSAKTRAMPDVAQPASFELPVAVNFQSEDAPVPQDYLKDFGKNYSNAQGFGWIEQGAGTPLDLTAYGRDRDDSSVSDQRLDTLMHMQHPEAADAGVWEIAVPDGPYDVEVSVGDPNVGNDLTTHNMNVEGQSAIDGYVTKSADFTATGDERFKSATVEGVEVADGKLTVDAKGGTNTKINYVVVSEATVDPTPQNQAPVADNDSYTTDEDTDLSVGAAEGVLANDTDADEGDTLTATLVDDAQNGSLTLNDDGSFSYTPAAGFTGEDTFTYRATDGTDESGLATVTITVNASDGGSGSVACSPRSTLPCAEVPVDPPVNLTFDGSEGGLEDADGQGTGFTMVDPPSVPLSTPSNPDVPGYEKDNLDVADGKLTITSTKGIMYLKPSGDGPTSSDTNSQVNALGVGVDASGKTTRIETTVVNPSFPSTNKYEQGGLWFGLDEDNYAKVAILNQGGGNTSIQLLREVNAVAVNDDSDPANDDQLDSENFSNLSSQNVKLILVADAAANTVTASYKIGDGAETELGTLDVPAKFFSGTKLNADAAETASFAGLFDTNRRASNPINMTFENFSVTAEEPPADTEAPTAPANLAATAGDGKVDLSWDTNTENDLAGYNVYRDGGNTPLNNAPLTDASYTDNDVTNGTAYAYTVTAVDNAGNESAASAEASATPKAATQAPDETSYKDQLPERRWTGA